MAEFNFSFPFRPVKQNVIVDNLSLPSSNNLLQCMEVYTNLIPADQVKAVLDRTESKCNNTWSVCLNIPMVEAQKILDNLTPTMCFTVKDYQKGQQAEYWISRVKNIIKGKVSLTKACKKREPQDVQQLLKDHSKLSINAGNILCRTDGEVCQTILSRMCKEAVYKELPMNLIHLGVDRTLQLIKDRFYWSKMEEDIRYFISNICSCVRQKKPNIQATAPLVPISSSSPLEIIGIYFLHLEKSSGGFKYIFLLTDH